jgi:hypothetical protein
MDRLDDNLLMLLSTRRCRPDADAAYDYSVYGRCICWDVALSLLGVCKSCAASVFGIVRFLFRLEDAQTHALLSAMLGKNVFITGGGGVGKTHVVNIIKSELTRAKQRVSCVAPTGVAASNVGGTTIHKLMNSRPQEINKEPSPNNPIPLWVNGSNQKQTPDKYVDEDGNLVDDEELDLRGYSDDLPPEQVFCAVKDYERMQNLRNMSTIVVDEISMVNGRLFETMRATFDLYRGPIHLRPQGECEVENCKRDNCFHRRKPTLSGHETQEEIEDAIDGLFDDLPALDSVQQIVVGDFAQLPPVMRQNTIETKAHAFHLGQISDDKKQFIANWDARHPGEPGWLERSGMNHRVHAFQTQAWADLKMREIELTVPKRSTNVAFNLLLAEVRTGVFTIDTFRRLMELTAPEVDRRYDLAIFGRKNPERRRSADTQPPHVLAFNRECIERNPNPIVSIEPTREAYPWDDMPSKIRFQRSMEVKLGAMVMVTKNASSEESFQVLNERSGHFVRASDYTHDSALRAALYPCNGTMGTIVAIDTAHPPRYVDLLVRHFDGVSRTIRIRRRISRQASAPAPSKQWAERLRDESVPYVDGKDENGLKVRLYKSYTRQFPVEVAHGITAHKAQGATIRVPHLVYVDQCFEGIYHLYTMISRTSDPALMRLVGDPKEVMRQIDKKKHSEDPVGAFHARLQERSRLPPDWVRRAPCWTRESQ